MFSITEEPQLINGYDKINTSSDTLIAALYYYDRGYFVVPCCPMNERGECTFRHTHDTEKSIGKRPILGNDWQNARLTREEILQWWTQHPTANVGVLLEPSELMVIDLDSQEATDEASKYGLPPGPQVRAGRGEHHYFRNPKNIISLAIRKGESRSIDILSKGIVVGFGSIHRTGKRYELLTSWEDWPLENPPLWAEQLLLDSLKNHSAAADLDDDLPPVELEALQLSRWLHNVILHGQPNHHEKYPSRSEAVWAVVTALVEAGHENNTIASLLLDPRYKISAKPREQGARWIASEIGRARAKTHTKPGNGKDPGNGAAHIHEESEHEEAAGSSSYHYHLTDLGNGERLVARHGKNLRYCNPWKKWLTWDKTRWQLDNSQQVKQWARDTVRAIYAEASEAESEKERKALASHAMRSEQESRLNAMTNLAQMDVPVLPEQLDTNPWLLNVANGTLDLRTGDLRPHKREDLLTKAIPFPYNEEADCPLWEAVLERILGGNQELIEFVWKAIGYSLTGDTTEQCLFLLYGTGQNGKSVFLSTLSALLADYAQQAEFSSFLHKDKDTVRNDLAKLRGARFVSAVEVEQGRRLAEVVVKQLTGGDTIAARFLFQEYFDFTPCLKLWLAANHKPEITGTDFGIWRRIKLIPFTVTIPADERDGNLTAKLRQELPGILAWAVRGCLEWQKEGLPMPEAVRVATEAYRTESDVLGGFLEECCVVKDGVQVKAGDLLDAYQKWSGDKMTHNKMKARLEERGFRRERSTITGHIIWLRIGLLPSTGNDTD